VVKRLYAINGKTFRHRAFGPGDADLGQEMSFTYNDLRCGVVQLNERGLTRRFFFDADGNLIRKCEGTGITRNATSCSLISYSTWNPR
jgi:hypothetical protein